MGKEKKNNPFKISNFEYGTIRRQEGKVVLDLSKQHVTYESIKQLDSLYKEKPNFLRLEDIKEDETSVGLIYTDIDSMKLLLDIKKEEYPVKLSVLSAILTENILEKQQISIHPSVILYHPMEKITYCYCADNEHLPYDNRTSNFEKYRALALFVVTGFSYEKCLGQRRQLEKVGNALVKNILATKNTSELTQLIHDVTNFVSYEYISAIKADKAKFKKLLQTTLVGAAAVIVILSFLTSSIIRGNANQVIASMEYEATQTQNELAIQTLINQGDSEKAADKMEELQYSDSDIAEMYYSQGEFQKALDCDASKLEAIIEVIYQQQEYFNEHANADQYDTEEQPMQQLLNLEITVTDDESQQQSNKLEIEKAIARYDTDTMKNKISFTEDTKTAMRMLNAFLAHDNLLDSMLLLSKFTDSEFQDKYDLKNEELEAEKEAQALRDAEQAQEEQDQDQSVEEPENI